MNVDDLLAGNSTFAGRQHPPRPSDDAAQGPHAHHLR